MTGLHRCLLPLSAALLAVSAAAAAAPASSLQVPEGFIFAAGGDMIGPYHDFPKPQDPGFAQVAALFRGADLGYANQEGSIFEIKDFRGYPAAENGGGYPLQRSAFARDIKGMGISLVSKANNHATDWGSDGLAAHFRVAGRGRCDASRRG